MPEPIHSSAAPSRVLTTRLLAALLNLCVPGAGLMYWERKPRGSQLFVLSIAYLMLCLSAWVISPFHTDTLLALTLTPWFLTNLYLVLLIWRSPVERLPSARPQGRLSGPLALALIGALPVLFMMMLMSNKLMMWVRVSDDAMFPLLLKGDVVAVDRRTIAPQSLKRGALVAVECPHHGPTLTRLIAFAERGPLRVHISPLGALDVSPDLPLTSFKPNTPLSPTMRLNGALSLKELTALSEELDARFPQRLRLEDHLLSFELWTQRERALISERWWTREQSPWGEHLSSTPRVSRQRPRERSERVEVGQIFVMPDLRDPESPSWRCAGALPAWRLLGRPLYLHRGAPAHPRRAGYSLLQAQ